MNTRIIFCFILLSSNVFSQSFDDSLQKIWRNEQLSDSNRFRAISEHYTVYNSLFKTNLNLTKYHYKLAQQKKSNVQKITALQHRAAIQYQEGDMEAAKETLDKQLILVKQTNRPLDQLNIYLLQIGIALDEMELLKAIKLINEGRQFSKENKLVKGEITCLINSAIFYDLIGADDLSLQSLNEAELLSEEINYSDYIGLIWMHQGISYLNEHHYPKAIEFTKKALDFFLRNNNEFQQAACHASLAEAYNKLGNFDHALENVLKSLEIGNASNYELLKIERLILKATILSNSDVDEAKTIGLSVLEKVNVDSPHDIRRDAYKLLFNCYKSSGDTKTSLVFHELYMASKDSMRAEERNFASVREAVKYEFEQEMYETQLENEKSQAELESRQKTLTSIIVSVSVSIILTMFILFQIKKRSIQKKREAILKELEEEKSNRKTSLVVDTDMFSLNKLKIEQSLGRSLNKTDWKVLELIVNDPLIANKEIAQKAFRSQDGIASSLRRLYDYFEVRDTKYKKIALLMDVIKRSRS